MKCISTHVLDIAQGKPAKEVPVRLERQDASGNWVTLTAARTDHDGRCAQLLPNDKGLPAGLYRLAFDTASYFSGQKIEALYPLIEVTFLVRNEEERFHIPLLLSAHGYTTYRGS
jgi:5-hydroxyisourate hydrolase